MSPYMPFSAVSPKTTQTYCQKMKTLLEQGPEGLKRIKNKSTFTQYVCAIRHFERLSRCHQDSDVENLYIDTVQALGGIDAMNQLIKTLGKQKFSRRAGRVHKLKALPSNWTEEMLKAVRDQPLIMQAVIEILFLTGCRPSEISSILLKRVTTNGSEGLGIAIKGSKVTEHNGQKHRGMVFNLSDQLPALTELATTTLSKPLSNITTRQVQYLVLKLSNKLYGSSTSLTASCFRNNVAAQLKSQGADPIEIAKVLGHSTTTTQQSYGRSIYARNRVSWVAPTHINATRKIRVVPNSLETLFQSKISYQEGYRPTM